MKVHELKCWPEFYQPVLNGLKTFEVRRDDRGFKVGDVLHLREWSSKQVQSLTVDGLPTVIRQGYSGRSLLALVLYVMDLSNFGVSPGYVVMGIEPLCGTPSE